MRALQLPDPGWFLRYMDIGAGDPVRVYLHGLGFSADTLVHVASHRALSARRSLVVDLLGFGASDKPDGFGYTIEDHAATIISLLDEQKVRGCELIGHSMGGSIAIVIASTRPDLVSALVVAGANLDPGMGPVSARILALSEEEYVRTGFERELTQAREDARSDPASLSAVTVGIQALASPAATYRTARSLTGKRRPTFRQQLVNLDMERSFLVGSYTLGDQFDLHPERMARGSRKWESGASSFPTPVI